MLKPLGVVVKSMLAKAVKQGGTAMMEGLVEELLLVAMLLPMGLALRGCKEVRQGRVWEVMLLLLRSCQLELFLPLFPVV